MNGWRKSNCVMSDVKEFLMGLGEISAIHRELIEKICKLIKSQEKLDSVETPDELDPDRWWHICEFMDDLDKAFEFWDRFEELDESDPDDFSDDDFDPEEYVHNYLLTAD